MLLNDHKVVGQGAGTVAPSGTCTRGVSRNSTEPGNLNEPSASSLGRWSLSPPPRLASPLPLLAIPQISITLKMNPNRLVCVVPLDRCLVWKYQQLCPSATLALALAREDQRTPATCFSLGKEKEVTISVSPLFTTPTQTHFSLLPFPLLPSPGGEGSTGLQHLHHADSTIFPQLLQSLKGGRERGSKEIFYIYF